MQKSVVLDASALIALIYEEKGMELVEKHMPHSLISSVNMTEVASYMIKQGMPELQVIKLLEDLGLKVIDYDFSLAMTAAKLIKKTAAKGLSLGDRACLALAIHQNLDVLTADKVWSQFDLGIEINLIR